MAFVIRPNVKIIYKLRLNPQMRLSLNLLQLPLARLKDYIKQEIEKNPLIDAKQETSGESEPRKQRSKSVESLERREKSIAKPITLQEHLLKQLRMLARAGDEIEIGELIIGNLNDNGYLEFPIEDIAKTAKTQTSKVEKILFLIQTFDPVGVGSRDLRECLLLQLKAKGEKDSLVFQIVDKYLNELAKKRFEYIADKLKTSVERVKESIKEIARLEPKPGRAFDAEIANYLIPDAILRKDKKGYEVILNNWELPSITLNEKYKKMITQKNTPEDARSYLKERLKAARSLIDAVERRKHTIQNVIEAIVDIQKDFLDKGADSFKPMTLSQVANRIGKHKSTVSRAISNKYLQTPEGILELRDFLSSGVKQESGQFLSSKNIKFKIGEIVRKENKKEPLTDQGITSRLRKHGVSVSRRAIAKYRTQLKILPSPSRRE